MISDMEITFSVLLLGLRKFSLSKRVEMLLRLGKNQKGYFQMLKSENLSVYLRKILSLSILIPHFQICLR
jgi:hypothetical protein